MVTRIVGSHAHVTPWNLSDRYYYWYYTKPYFTTGNRDDVDIKNDVETLLRWDGTVDSDKIKVEVKNANVTLRGDVDSFFEKRVAGDDAADVYGVANVNNNLEVAA